MIRLISNSSHFGLYCACILAPLLKQLPIDMQDGVDEIGAKQDFGCFSIQRLKFVGIQTHVVCSN